MSAEKAKVSVSCDKCFVYGGDEGGEVASWVTAVGVGVEWLDMIGE